MHQVDTKFKHKHKKWILQAHYVILKPNIQTNFLIYKKKIGLPYFKLQEITIRWLNGRIVSFQITSFQNWFLETSVVRGANTRELNEQHHEGRESLWDFQSLIFKY